VGGGCRRAVGEGRSDRRRRRLPRPRPRWRTGREAPRARASTGGMQPYDQILRDLVSVQRQAGPDATRYPSSTSAVRKPHSAARLLDRRRLDVGVPFGPHPSGSDDRGRRRAPDRAALIFRHADPANSVLEHRCHGLIEEFVFGEDGAAGAAAECLTSLGPNARGHRLAHPIAVDGWVVSDPVVARMPTQAHGHLRPLARWPSGFVLAGLRRIAADRRQTAIRAWYEWSSASTGRLERSRVQGGHGDRHHR
jgi:hypothetical protein